MISLLKKPKEPDDEKEPEHGDEPDDQEHIDADAEQGSGPAAPAEPKTERQAAAQELRAALKEARTRLAQGSMWLFQWHKASLGEWCRAGRRDDLDGPSAVLGVWMRGGVLLTLAYGAWKVVEAQPLVLLVMGGGWLVAAAHAEHPEVRAEKRAARASVKEREEAETDEAAADQVEDQIDDESDGPKESPVMALIRAEIGTDRAVHLCDLYPAMRKALPGCSQAPDEVLREVLDNHHIRVQRSVRARGVAGRTGVRLSDLPPLPSPEGAPETLSTPLSTHGDTGQARNRERHGEQRRGAGRVPESPQEGATQIVQDPDNPVRWHVSHRP